MPKAHIELGYYDSPADDHLAHEGLEPHEQGLLGLLALLFGPALLICFL